MKRLAVAAIVGLCVIACIVLMRIGCSSKIKVPTGALVRYENHFVDAEVAVEKPLAVEIIAKLNDEPDSAYRNVAMPLDTRKYLAVGARTLQVEDNRLTLMDSWGVRTWWLEGIEARLEATIGLSLKITVPRRTTVRYENDSGGSVAVEKPLANEIIAKLANEPDYADRHIRMPPDTIGYLDVGAQRVHVDDNELVLVDDWGMRMWEFRGIEAKLDALMSKAPSNSHAGNSE